MARGASGKSWRFYCRDPASGFPGGVAGFAWCRSSRGWRCGCGSSVVKERVVRAGLPWPSRASFLRLARLGPLSIPRVSPSLSVSGDSALAGFPCLCLHLGAFRAMLQLELRCFLMFFNGLPLSSVLVCLRPGGRLIARSARLSGSPARALGRWTCCIGGRPLWSGSGSGWHPLRNFGRDSCNSIRHVLRYGRVVVWVAGPMRFAPIRVPTSRVSDPRTARGSCAPPVWVLPAAERIRAARAR